MPGTLSSLFLVRRGAVTLKSDKLVYKLLRKGTSFGETDFIKGSLSLSLCLSFSVSVSSPLPTQFPSSLSLWAMPYNPNQSLIPNV